MADYRVISRRVGIRFLYVVMRGDDQVFGPTDRASAERKCDQLRAAAQYKTRKCLCCRVEFESTGTHHRMCKICRQKYEFKGV